jgi:hypothetical protein
MSQISLFLINNLFLMRAIFLFILYFSLQTIKSQTGIIDPYQNPVILIHYSVPELQYYQNNDSLKFKTIRYYYTESFVFESVPCNSCTPKNLADFDVSEYEYLRLKSKRFNRHFEKYGFKLTLLSIDELIYRLPIHN